MSGHAQVLLQMGRSCVSSVVLTQRNSFYCGLKHVMVERLKLVLVDVVIVSDFWSSRALPRESLVFQLHQLPCWAGDRVGRVKISGGSSGRR